MPLMVTVCAPPSASIVTFWAVTSNVCAVNVTVAGPGVLAPSALVTAALMLVVPAWSLWRVTAQAPVASVKHVLTPPEKPPGPDVIVKVTVAASAGSGAFESGGMKWTDAVRELSPGASTLGAPGVTETLTTDPAVYGLKCWISALIVWLTRSITDGTATAVPSGAR